jgi:hypothetical protein
MKYITVVLAAAFCFQHHIQTPGQECVVAKNYNIMPAYNATRAHIAALKQHIMAAHINDTATLQKYFVSAVADSIIPYWYGTKWDFDGVTQIPGKGAIACGYFVSTVLRDAGLKLNRVAMGQSASETITKQLAREKDIKLFYNKPLPLFINYIKEKGFGLYLAGLDCHVGFILNDGSDIWFIHSKWFAETAVVKELAATSSVLYYSKYRMIGKISNNKTLLLQWLSN